MARRGPRAGADASKRARADAPLNAPFRGLRQRLETHAPPPPTVKPAPKAPPPPDDAILFSNAMQGVARLAAHERERIAGPAPAAEPRSVVTEEAEALATLSDLVNGDGTFDISETREYLEGHVLGLDPRVVRRLRRGDFAWQAHLDLHGMTAAVARDAVERFVVEGARAGLRCLLVVHGRGLNSKDQIPVLKERMKTWLARGRIGRHVLAFTSARAVDGGAGALYVLLRRDRTRRPIRVTEGTKR
ncbi:MAG TPA: Smr/MutS family protein [Candidatus Eisenbacteria bacterium]|nr:Smr/MutS family protein [Candidatus Eisenbacteria bacterium]